MKQCIIALVCLLVSGCSVYKHQPKVEITHVLAVTSEGDTLRLPISMIKPNVYYNITHYPNRYYNLPHNYWYNNNWHLGNSRPVYVPRGTNNSNNNNNNSNNNPPNTGNTKPIPAVINPPATPTRPNRGGN